MSEEKDYYERLSDERKALQKEGLVPKWYSTGGYQMFKEKYEYQTEGARSVDSLNVLQRLQPNI